MLLFVGNMMCDRCKMLVKEEIEKFGLHCNSVELGEVEVEGRVPESILRKIGHSLNRQGYVLIHDKKNRIIEKIKLVILDLTRNAEEPLKINISDYISSRVNYEYSYLSTMFSEIQGITIEKYFINQKIERVKEMLIEDDLSLSQIAERLNYSDVAHLSRQFKKVTGLTPSLFKQLKMRKKEISDSGKYKLPKK